MEHLLELAVGPGEELADLLALERGQRRRPGQLVDEEPVPLVGGDAAGAGVRLGEIPVTLQGRHLVADGRGRHAQVARAGDVGRTDWLRGLNVLADHGPQHGGLPIVEHHPSGT